MKCQSLFSGINNKKKKNISICRLLTLPSVGSRLKRLVNEGQQ